MSKRPQIPTTKRIQICHVQLLPLLSGVQRAMLEIIFRLDPVVYEPVVLCKEEGDLTTVLAAQDIEYVTMPDLVRAISPWHDLKSWITLKRFFSERHFDIVHTHSSKTGILGRWAAYSSNVPVIIHTVQGLPFHEFSPLLQKQIYGWAERKAGMISSKVIFVNREERELAISQGIIEAEKAVTIFNGVDLEKVKQFNNKVCRDQFRQKWGISEDEFIIGYVGRLWEQKDPETLLRTIEICADLPVRFLIVGDGPYKSHFEQNFRNNHRVLMTGWLDDPMAMYPAIDVLLLPSLWEGLSVTLIEAMAFAKPLIASNIKGNRECVWQGENGFLCAPRDPHSFRYAIASLVEDRSLYNRMSLSGRQKAVTFFDAEKNSRQIIALYEQQLAALRS
ncbi:MAG TPA: glycosyltransferase family 4 protein [bacterium]|nr:glycosyltransferase family 4 protein [bacterium]